jgi:fatty acid desaturase
MLDGVHQSLTSYASQVRARLSPAAFAPAHSRLLWLPVHLLCITVATWAVSSGLTPWPLVPLLSLLIGMSFAGLAFVAHEALHGAIVHHRLVRYLVGWLGFLPFCVSPRLWIAWHNRVHHGHTNQPDVDPDAYPTLAVYERKRSVRVAIDLAPGGSRWTFPLAPLIGFTVQSSHVLLRARSWGLLSSRARVAALAESALGAAVWVTLALCVGPVAFAFVFMLPLLVANAIIMGFILTNHSMSPLTAKNDPLVNSLSVTLPRWAEWLTLHFGYHVEHHVFPAMSGRHAPRVREALLALWPDRYQSLPLARALSRLHRTARVYKTTTTVVDPRSGREWPTLRGQELERAHEAEPGAARESNRLPQRSDVHAVGP